MKKYEFHSVLPPELVFAALRAQAKETRSPDPWSERDQFFFRRKGERFWLSYTGTVPMTGFIPFSGIVRAEGTGSVISGSFSVWRALWKLLAVISAAMFLLGLLFGASLGFALFGAVLCFVWFLFVMWLMQKPFGKRRRAVLAFLEKISLLPQEKQR